MIRIRIFVMLGVALICFTVAANAFDVMSLPPIADKNIQTGNRMLYEKEMLENSTQVENLSNDYLMDVNEIPVRFDETQLWRIYNISNDMRNEMPVAETLENKFGGVIWKENSKFLDISIGKEHLKAARSFLIDNQLDSEILNGNIQDLIDMEQLEGAEATQGIAGRRIKKAARSGMNWKDYQDLDVIYAFMREIRGKFPNICRLYTIGKTTEGRDLKVLRITESESNNAIWIDGGIHAREWISPSTVTYILNELITNWSNQPSYIKQKTWYIMPVLNPDGYMYSRKTNRLWRKNRRQNSRSTCRGVDLNRNFNINWRGQGSSSNPCSDVYRGASAASEPETKSLVNFLASQKSKLKSYLTFHSYGQVIVFPWGYKAAMVSDAGRLKAVANKAVKTIKQRTGVTYRAGTTYKLLGIASGGSDDWTRATLGIKYVYTIELRDRGQRGFILPPKQIIGTGKEGLAMVQAVAQAFS
ncbi:carboxypeptidase B isoform X2 [Teleopsis dalmanni]|uniref:carboxypeptidase B isoform X2 n=1 Tax=Teleopsis dalmanni TaxID=139649 RepID=UPI0018CCCD79|nr:carboxypeptidase B isoform X2 [Teleopsis dalmanni]